MKCQEYEEKADVDCLTCTQRALEAALLQNREFQADLGRANENISLLLGKLRDQLAEIVKDWGEAFARHGFILHPGLTPEQNAAEWKAQMNGTEKPKCDLMKPCGGGERCIELPLHGGPCRFPEKRNDEVMTYPLEKCERCGREHKLAGVSCPCRYT